MNKRLKVAVIGTGNMGKNHIRTYSEIVSIDLAAVADVNEQAVKEIAKQYNINAYTSTRELLRMESPDIVSICVPTTFHYQVAKECIDQGVHILIEKPITANIKEAEELIQLAKKKKVKLHVGHIERFNPAVIKLKEIIDNGELGEIIAVVARRVGGLPPSIRDVSIAIDLVIHDVDIINYLLNDLPKKVTIHSSNNNKNKEEDSTEFFLQYKNASAYIQANWITPVKIRKLNITGTKGYIEMDYVNQTIYYYKNERQLFKEGTITFSEYISRFSYPNYTRIKVNKKEPLKEELLYFVNCIERNIYVDPTYAIDALKTVLK